MKVYIGKYTKEGEERKVEVRIDKYDIWSADYTLALIISPTLKKIREAKQGAPWVDDEDVPSELRSFNGTLEGCLDSNWFLRWDYVLDEMIYAFDAIINQSDDEVRIDNGLRLFGKYYRGLWS